MCGDEKQYKSPTIATRCFACASKTRKEESLVGVKRTCIDCEKVDMLKTPSAVVKAPRCGSCAAKERAKNIPMPSKKRKPIISEDGMRYFRICPECPEDNNTIEVSTEANSGVKRCLKCSMKHRKPRVRKSRAKTKKKYTPIGVDGLQKVNIRKPKVQYQVVDLETMEAPVKKREPKEYVNSTPDQDAEMIAEFLKRREQNVS